MIVIVVNILRRFNQCEINMNNSLLEILKIFVVSSILFVWVIRYSNIIEEFKIYTLPNWLRDLVGILKIAFAIMLFNENVLIVKVGAIGISVLMICAILTHLRVKNTPAKMLPSAILLVIQGLRI
jgi:hypothetical protein